MRVHLKPLAEQVVVITGASSGIGLATATAAAREGAKLVIASRNADALEAAAAEMRHRGGQVAVCATDVGVEAEVERLAAFAIETFGGFDTWVNDAAAATYGTLSEVTIEDHRKVFESGYWGTVYGSLAAARHLRQRGGAIVNVGSILSERAINMQGPYCAMKHAVRGFTDALRVELAAEGAPVSVTLIKPAAIDTPYPEHARNYMPTPATLPPILYDARLVAKAILFAAANPKRELTVGGTAGLMTGLALLFPGIADRAMAEGGEAAQQTGDAPAPGTEDNLHQPRADGAIDGSRDVMVRRTSLWLEAQMRPALATAMLSTLSFAAIAALSGPGLRRRTR